MNISACPNSPNQLVVETRQPGAPVSESEISIGVLSESQDGLSLIRGQCFKRPDGAINGLLWESRDKVLISHSSGVVLYNSSAAEPQTAIRLADCVGAVADPHHAFTVVSASGKSLCLWDMRTSGVGYAFKTSNFFGITSLDVNPNSENIVATGGADGRISIWDIRGNLVEPLKSFEGHNHTVTQVKYNPVHDELLLSAGTDCAVNLWCVLSVSSNPSRHKQLIEKPDFSRSRRKSNEDSTCGHQDGLIQKYNRHEDSVYRASWGCGSSAWAFATASYDGLAMFNSVPGTERQRIMM